MNLRNKGEISVIVHLTKKFADKLKLAPKPIQTEADLFSWTAHFVQGHGFRFVVMMHDATRFSIVLNEAKMPKLKKLETEFKNVLALTFHELGVNPEIVDQFINDLGEITFSKNSNRSSTAKINKVVEGVWAAFRFAREDLDLSLWSNRQLYKMKGAEDYRQSYELMLEILGDHYEQPVLKRQALDLKIRLDLDGKDAIRCLRVPANLRFDKFHKLLQIAFGWNNSHLCSFGIFKEWSSNPYAEPLIDLAQFEEDMEYRPNAELMKNYRLSDFLPEYDKILYSYDFGDDWKHYIELENVVDNYEQQLPILLSGSGDTPPEDVGGVGGYHEFLEVMSNPNHEDYEHFKAWSNSQWWKPFDEEYLKRRFRYFE